jgi:hypothetical protein
MLLTWGLARALRPHTRELICRHVNCMLDMQLMQATCGVRAQRDRCTRFGGRKIRARTSLPLKETQGQNKSRHLLASGGILGAVGTCCKDGLTTEPTCLS